MKSLMWLARVGKNNSQTERNPKTGARHIVNARFIHVVLISMGFIMKVHNGTTYALRKRIWRALSNQFSSITVPEPLFLILLLMQKPVFTGFLHNPYIWALIQPDVHHCARPSTQIVKWPRS
jgi:hypothetical protein